AGARAASDPVATAPGVSLRQNGQYASAPLVHGMGDERVRILVDGATIGNACPNHMNPALSYAAPSQAASVAVMAGITPVSMGGDSLAGTIVVESPAPAFAADGERLLREFQAASFYRSNGQEYGGSVREQIASRNLAFAYLGRYAQNGNYTDGSGYKVTSTYAESFDHALKLAWRAAGNLFEAEGGYHRTPFEGFVNQRMDVVRNVATAANLRWRRALGPGSIDARLYWQGSFHNMNMGHDKPKYMTMWMPMNTHGRDLGYSVRYEAPLSPRHTLRLGNELHRFRLDDIWPAVPGTAPMMGPNAFISINNGRRLRMGSWAELASTWNPRWSTLLGMRNDTVWSDAGKVQGYCNQPTTGMACPYSADANAFNAASHSRTDAMADLTAAARYTAGSVGSLELGFARKNRAPNLYERYAWSTMPMASEMIGWFGDLGFYVGSLKLTQETANTLSATLTAHSGPRWELKATPYQTWIEGMIDVNRTGTKSYAVARLAQLQFANHDARIAGLDMSGKAVVWGDPDAPRAWRSVLTGTGGWVHGTRRGTMTPLYQMMPVHAHLAFDEEWMGLGFGAGLEAVDRKHRVDPNRIEQPTPGYTLFNLHASYRRGPLDAGLAADNLTNRRYELPLGGLNYDQFQANMRKTAVYPVTGPGRSVGFHLSGRF
ncbi:MAG: TonB-dependent receptor plug domain-containing protein, partial [Terracidiphilus sp.]